MVSTKLEKALLTFLPPNLPVDGFYSSLTHGSHQRPLAWSKRNMAIVPSWVPDKRAPGLMNPSIRMLSLLMCAEGKARLWDTAMEDISMFHGQSILTHILWNHSGNFFASIDEKGKIAIWANKKYLNTWLPIYTVEMHNPVICCEWINPDRMYVAKEDPVGGEVKYGRERTIWSRDSLALVLLTSDGQLVAIHKPNGHYFTHITTLLPPRSGSEDQIASRISHGAIICDATDGIQLATHACNSLPSTVNVYQIHLRFAPEVMFRCDAKAILYLSNPLAGGDGNQPGSLMAPSVLHHLQWLPKTASRPFSIAVALADRSVADHQVDEGGSSSNNEDGAKTTTTTVHYRSQVVIWDMVVKVVSFHPAFHDLSTRRSDANTGQPSLTFALAGEHHFPGKFVSTMTCIQRTRELVVGLSNGSIIGLDTTQVSNVSGLQLAKRTHLSGFSGSKVQSPPVTLHSSPNGLCLMVLYLCGRISTLNLVPPKTADAITETPDSTKNIDINTLAQITILAIVNEWDYTDIIAKVVAATRSSTANGGSGGHTLLADRLLERMFRSFTRISGAEDPATNECAFLPQSSLLRRMLAFQLVLFQSLPAKKVQYKATSALLQLFSLGEVFMGSCTSDPAALAAHMDTGASTTTTSSSASSTPQLQQTSPSSLQNGQQSHNNNPPQLKFDKDTLWSLLPLAGWTLELCTVIFRELAMFLNVKKSHHESRSRVSSQDHGIGMPSPSIGSPVMAAALGQQQQHPSAATPTILCLLYHARARRTLRNLLTLIEQYHLYLKNREQLYMRVIKSGGPVEATAVAAGSTNNELLGMTIAEAIAMREIHIATLFQHVDSLVTRCPLKITVVKAFLRDLANIGPGGAASRSGQGTPNPNQPASATADSSAAMWQEQSVLLKGVVPPATVSLTSATTATASQQSSSNVQAASLAQARTELQMMTRRYPTLWDMNRLVFATIHWLDLEPSPAIVYPTRISRLQKLAAIHPNRCRIDAVAAIRSRVPGGAGSVGGTGGGWPGGSLQHSSSHHYLGGGAGLMTPVAGGQQSNNSSYIGSRSNSISSVAGGVPKAYTESPAELPLAQQSSTTQPFVQAFGSARRPSTMTALPSGGTGSTAGGGVGGGQGIGPLDVAPPVVPSAAAAPSFWGQENGFDGWSDDDDVDETIKRDFDDGQGDQNQGSSSSLAARLGLCIGHATDSTNSDRVTTITADDTWEDDGYVYLQQIESDDDDFNDVDSENRHHRHPTMNDSEGHVRAHGAAADFDEDIELPAVDGETRGDSGDDAQKQRQKPSFSSKAQEVATRTLPAWTVFGRLEAAHQILHDERNVVQGVLMSSGIGNGGTSLLPFSMGGGGGLPANNTSNTGAFLSAEAYFEEMARVEAQSRKRRLGVDWIRKSKRYKAQMMLPMGNNSGNSSGRGRRCIRCLQIATTTSGGSSGSSQNATTASTGAGALPQPPPQTPGAAGGSGGLGSGGLTGQDMTAKTLWYHNYDRSCICGGMWLEL